MRASSAIGLAAAIVMGIIVADFVAHPKGTKAVAQGVVNLATPTYAALLGNVPTGYTKA